MDAGGRHEQGRTGEGFRVCLRGDSLLTVENAASSGWRRILDREHAERHRYLAYECNKLPPRSTTCRWRPTSTKPFVATPDSSSPCSAPRRRSGDGPAAERGRDPIKLTGDYAWSFEQRLTACGYRDLRVPVVRRQPFSSESSSCSGTQSRGRPVCRHPYCLVSVQRLGRIEGHRLASRLRHCRSTRSSSGSSDAARDAS